MPLQTELLRTFAAVAETGSVTRAGETLHCSQPAVSRRLAQLEATVGAQLFERVPAGMKLSAAGEQLLPYAETALAAVRDGLEAVRGLREEVAGPLTVAIVGTLASTSLTGVLRALAGRHPRLELLLRTATSVEAIDLVRRGEATFGISYAFADEPALTSEVLFEEELLVACAPDHPRANATVRSLAQLRGERWLAFPAPERQPETSARRLHGVLAAAGVPAEAVSMIDSLTAQKRLVEAGFGIALMQQSAVPEELAAGTLATIGLRTPAPRIPVTVTRRSRGYLSNAARTLLAELRDWTSRPAGAATIAP
jgi:DNA-binding transcriptional LysR family regulator